MEKVIANRIRSYLERNDLSNHYQSAYNKYHSTETALVKVENDIIFNSQKPCYVITGQHLLRDSY